ncbi:MAG: heavy-metal-associated domain-containing protein [Rhodothermales bacterium]
MLRPLVFAATLGGLACVPCLGPASFTVAARTADAHMLEARADTARTAHFEIAAPFCSGCVDTLVETAEAVAGVREAAVDLEGPTLDVTFDDAQTSPAAVRAHVERETRFRLRLTRVSPHVAP